MIGENIKFLRKRLGKSQEELATLLKLTRSTLSGYENGVAEPSIDTLTVISNFFDLSIDDLVKKQLSKVSSNELETILGRVGDIYSGQNLRILTQIVNSENEDVIEMIPFKASAGYTTGYADAEYLKLLPTFQLPFLSKQKKYRSFPIQGDSMPPVSEGSFVVAEYIENWTSIKDGTPCIVITEEEGIVFKIVYNHLESRDYLELYSTNTFYKPFKIKGEKVLEIWKFVNYIASDLPTIRIDELDLKKSLIDLQQELREVKLLIQK
jgi:transcriptional regulator with XRE-family HTH domain